VSELPPHAEATNRTATSISSRLMVLVCQTLLVVRVLRKSSKRVCVWRV